MNGSRSIHAPLVYRIPHAAELLGISIPTLYRLVQRGDLELVKVGVKASAIPAASIARFAVQRGIGMPSEARL